MSERGHIARRRELRLARCAALSALLALPLSGCDEPNVALHMRELELPEGGQVLNLVPAASASGSTLVAAGRWRFFKYDAEQSRWLNLKGQWPQPLKPRVAEETLTSQAQLLWHQDALWTSAVVSGVSDWSSDQLFMSDDLGLGWSRGALPEGTPRYRHRWRGDFTLPQELSLFSKDQALYLMSAQGIWRLKSHAPLNAKDVLISPESWEPISLEGLPIQEQSLQQGLPLLLRHYLPASAQRPYELLTVLGDQLLLYRREEGQTSWVLTYTLPTVDLELLHDLQDEPALILTPEGVYASLEAGELWSTQPYVPDKRSPASLTTMTIVPTPGQQPNIWLVGSAQGAIYRSPDAGLTWDKVYHGEHSAPVEQLLYNAQDRSVWARARGYGVLRSTDQGMSWQRANTGLRLAQPLAMSVTNTGELLLGTDAGLFELKRSPLEDQRDEPQAPVSWEQLHPEEVSAIALGGSGAEQTIWMGGRYGQLWRMERGSSATPVSYALSERAAQLFNPRYASSVELPEAAILSLTLLNGRLYGYTRQRGQFSLSTTDDAQPLAVAEPTDRTLVEVLEQGMVTSHVIINDQVQAMTTFSTKPNVPSQLWRTEDSGMTWRAVEPLSAGAPNQPPMLYSAGAKAGALSLFLWESGHLWRLDEQLKHRGELVGPWQDPTTSIEALALNEGGASAALLKIQGKHELHLFDAELNQLKRRYTVSWPSGQLDDEVFELMLWRRQVYARTKRAVYEGELDSSKRQPDQVMWLISAVALLLLSGLAFGTMKRFDARKPTLRAKVEFI